MICSPIEDLRGRLTNVAARRGMSSPSTLRVSQYLDRFVNEWYRAAAPGALAAQALHQPKVKDRTELAARIAEAAARSDGSRMSALLPLVMNLPKNDADRPALLLTCAMHSRPASGYGPVWMALEEAAATAPRFSALQLRALSALASIYLEAGRLHAAYYLCRSVLRSLHRFPVDETWSGALFCSFGSAARWRGKVRLARRALLQAEFHPQFQQHSADMIESERFGLDAHTEPLHTLKHGLRSMYADNRYRVHLLASYAGALLRHGYARAAIAMAGQALNRTSREHTPPPLTQAELYIVLAAASEHLGRHAPSQAFVARARQILGADEHQMIARRMLGWQPPVVSVR